MLFQTTRIIESLLANAAYMRRFTRVYSNVDCQISIQSKRFATITADVRPFAAVRSHVTFHLPRLFKRSLTHLANELFLACVYQHVQSHVSAARECLWTRWTLVGFFFCVNY